LPGFTACRSRPVPPTIALWGDSHAAQLAKGLASRARDAKGSILFLVHGGCPPGTGANRVHGRLVDPNCRVATNRVVEELRRHPGISTLVLSSRWSNYTENVPAEGEEGLATYLTDDLNSELTSDNSRRVLRESLDRAVSLVERMNVRVVILNQVPEFGLDTARCVAHARWRSLPESRCFASTARVRARFAASIAIMRDLARAHPSVQVIDPIPLFCDDTVCRSVIAGELLYGDDDHLSLIGNEYLLRRIAIDWDPNNGSQLRPEVTMPPGFIRQ
jgi:hypothetical protein